LAKKTRSNPKRATVSKGRKRPATKASKKARLRALAAPVPAIQMPTGPRLKKSPFSRAELKEFRQMLLDKRQGLLGDMTRMEAEALRTNRQEGTGDLSKIPTHDADVGTDNFEQEFTLGLLESERTLLTEINEALERIDKGTYGICLGTGLAIGKARLKARPWAKYCIEYARMIEKGLVHQGQERESGGEEQAEEPEGREEEPEEEAEEDAEVEVPDDTDKSSEE
jgi:RNA polymerase-binding protein DksA